MFDSLGIGSRRDWRKTRLESKGYIEGEQEEPEATSLKSHLRAERSSGSCARGQLSSHVENAASVLRVNP